MTGFRRETALSLCRRSMVLPRVCKRWAMVLTLPSLAWERVDIDGKDLRSRGRLRRTGQPLVDARVVSTWFSRSGPLIKHSRHCHMHRLPASTSHVVTSSCVEQAGRLCAAAEHIGWLVL